MNIAFYINEPAIADIVEHPGFSYNALCFSLLEGDFKNDKVPRCVRLIYDSQDEAQIIKAIKLHAKEELKKRVADVFYAIGLTSRFANELRALKQEHPFQLFIVNQPQKRHPASLVAIADGVKRLKGHHISASCGDLESHYHGGIDISFSVRFCLDYMMMRNGCSPLFVNGEATDIEEWHFSPELVRGIVRLCDLFDNRINWTNPSDPAWRMPDEEKQEFNELFPAIIKQLREELAPWWQLDVLEDRM